MSDPMNRPLGSDRFGRPIHYGDAVEIPGLYPRTGYIRGAFTDGRFEVETIDGDGRSNFHRKLPREFLVIRG